MKRRFPIEYYLINDVLMEWNPLGVCGPALEDEYISYIPRLIKIRDDKGLLLKFLGDMLRDFGIDCNPIKDEKNNKLMEVVEKINTV